jgi:hypothetical protein
MQITLTNFTTGKLIASRKVIECEFGYIYRANPKRHFDEFEQALYALNNGKPDGILTDEFGEKQTVRFSFRSEITDFN